MFSNTRKWEILMNRIISWPYSSSLMIAGKTEDSNNLTWVDGYQNKNAYVMTNIYRYEPE